MVVMIERDWESAKVKALPRTTADSGRPALLNSLLGLLKTSLIPRGQSSLILASIPGD